MGDTTIQWTDKVWNPVTGCSKVSQGCKNCYAERIFQRPYPGRDFTDVRTHEDRLDAPLHWRKPARIFVNSMSDLFHEKVPFKFIDQVWAAIGQCPRHTFQILTKRPERMLEYARYMAGGDHISTAEWPRNTWLGVSVEDQKTADERIPLLLQTPAAVRWVSYEPALGPVDFTEVYCGGQHSLEGGWPTEADIDWNVNPNACRNLRHGVSRLDWIVCGGESGPKARPMHPDWARSVRDQCQAAGVPFFFKQWGEWSPIQYGDGVNVANVPGEDGTHHRMNKVGKHVSGRLLDGREWNEFPA